ncbi:hypothetical protein K505DRAFT_376389 [Melanomma pulvis-pyrius CBS 109.77]|uniref:Uncharacterized protein n=1 Tax=Melanomma pulvis-pyrius CBS 109.77 TaxID=1314802 RepID=A0A6A6X7S9_9PLEO|nr:hypothetical protein K505DRAFT_376389 [Melanomma pulvis-pyrius CBS 109.77]
MSTPSSVTTLRELRLLQSSKVRKDRPDILKMPVLHSAAILFLPPLFFWITVDAISESWPSWFETCPVTGGCVPAQGNTNEPSPMNCAFKDILERPNMYMYILFLVANLSALFKYRDAPEKLKKCTFVLHLLTTLAIRCLSSFSGIWTSDSYPFNLPSSNSPGKIFWLFSLVAPWLWHWTYLGTYTDVWYDPATRSVRDEHGAVTWVFTSEAKPDEDYDAYSPVYMPWQDTVVRLSYIHVVDNLIHVLWLRFYQSAGAYTAYVNNSELLTLLLAVEMGLYTYSRAMSHVVFARGGDEEMDVGAEKTALVARRCAVEGLVGGPSTQLPFLRFGICDVIAGIAISGVVCLFVAFVILMAGAEVPLLSVWV